LQTLEGKSGGDQFGAAVSGAGDFDGDGVLDFLVGEPHADNDAPDGGTVYVLSGADGRVLFQADRRGDWFGAMPGGLAESVAAADLNGDSVLDLIVGSPWDNQALLFLSPWAAALPNAGPTDPAGAVIAQLLTDRFSDIDSPAVGLAIRAAEGPGAWQFSLDGGQTFQDTGTVNASQSLLLRPTDRLRYIPAAGQSGTASLELTGWDLSSGVAGAKVDTTTRGGSTAFAADSVTAFLHLARENHAPTATNLDQTVSYVEGDRSVPLGDIVVTDIDVADEITVTLTLHDETTGSLSVASSSGEQYNPTTGVWTMTGSVGQVNTALAAVQFVPAMENDRDTAVAVLIADGGENGASALSGVLVLDATPVNDAPVLRTFDVRTILGNDSDASFGHLVAAAGDVDADGVADFIVESSDTGRSARAVVYSGADHSVLHDFSSARGAIPTASAADDANGDGAADLFVATGSEVRLISGSDGSVLYSVPARQGVSSIGDVSGDGYVDFLSGIRLMLFSGKDGSILEPDFETKIGHHQSLAGVGDVNGDGFGDIAVGENSLWGTSRVVSGADLSVLFQLPGDSPSDYLGAQVSGVGDVNADGVPDVAAVGGANYVRVFSGADAAVLYDFHGSETLGRFSIGSGGRVAGGGDVNADGYADIVVAGSRGVENLGTVHVFSGADGSVLYSLAGDSPEDHFGSDLALVGDVNGDGLDDIIVGAPQWRWGGPGYVRVFMPIEVWNIDVGPIDMPTSGAAVADLFPDLLSDVDTGALQGIAIQSVTGEGSWQFSLDGGQTFLDVGHVATSQSLLLRFTDRLRYVVRRPMEHGPGAQLEFTGWDQSEGVAGTRVDTSVRGGSTAFTNRTAMARLPIAPEQTLDPRLKPGDANRDFLFDRLDLAQLVESGHYLSGEEASWAEGDFNGDLVFNQYDIVASLQEDIYLRGRYTSP
jgi:hypothetical protein